MEKKTVSMSLNQSEKMSRTVSLWINQSEKTSRAVSLWINQSGNVPCQRVRNVINRQGRKTGEGTCQRLWKNVINRNCRKNLLNFRWRNFSFNDDVFVEEIQNVTD